MTCDLILSRGFCHQFLKCKSEILISKSEKISKYKIKIFAIRFQFGSVSGELFEGRGGRVLHHSKTEYLRETQYYLPRLEINRSGLWRLDSRESGNDKWGIAALSA